jgi:hypothetical protein
MTRKQDTTTERTGVHRITPDPFASLNLKRPRIIATTVTARRPLTATTSTGRTLKLVDPGAEPQLHAPLRTPVHTEPKPARRIPRDQRRHKEELIAAARRRIAEENRASSELPVEDARRIVATRIAQALEGGRAAILTPDVRRGIVTEAKRMGLRPFDANLIIAIVQDRARTGEPADQLAADGRIRLVREAGARRGGLTETGNSETAGVGTPSEMVAACIAFGTAVALVTLLISWTLGIWPA